MSMPALLCHMNIVDVYIYTKQIKHLIFSPKEICYVSNVGNYTIVNIAESKSGE